jgi:hypothetical protein
MPDYDGRNMQESMMDERIDTNEKRAIKRGHRDTRSRAPNVARCRALAKVNGQSNYQITEDKKCKHCAYRRHVMADIVEQFDQTEVLHRDMREDA